MTLKSLLLQLLSVLPTGEPFLAVSALVRAGAVFGYEPGVVRVTLSRLQAAGLVEAAGRGRWRLTAAAIRVAEEVAHWRHLDDRVRPWTGGWLGIATGGLGRTDRTAVRRRERALALYGFRELRPGLVIRPDNRVEPLPTVRAALNDLGLEPAAPLLVLAELGPHQAEASALWDVHAIDQAYRDARASLGHARVIVGAAHAAPDTAARTLFAAGSAVLRLLAFDPLLPEAIADPTERRRLVAEMSAFDDDGRALWRSLLTAEPADPPAPTPLSPEPP